MKSTFFFLMILSILTSCQQSKLGEDKLDLEGFNLSFNVSDFYEGEIEKYEIFERQKDEILNGKTKEEIGDQLVEFWDIKHIQIDTINYRNNEILDDPYRVIGIQYNMTSWSQNDSIADFNQMSFHKIDMMKSVNGEFIALSTQSEDDSDLTRVLGNGTLQFDTNGRFLVATGTTISMDLDGTGALTPQAIEMVFDEPADSLSALASNESSIAATNQDGSAIGTLEDYYISEDGVIHGTFSNSLTRDLGQLVLANFVNQDGLSEEAGNVFDVTASSGNPIIGAPGTNGTGGTVGQALELSNVDISAEFITLINASTGYSANSRVFSTADQLMQELMQIIG